jgi:translation initiation factor 2B subunit (eIF-2B alpha/beta/delta family)
VVKASVIPKCWWIFGAQYPKISFSYSRDLMVLVSAEGKKLTKSLPLQASVGNMVRRILKIIREEYVATQQVRNATEMHAVIRFSYQAPVCSVSYIIVVML